MRALTGERQVLLRWTWLPGSDAGSWATSLNISYKEKVDIALMTLQFCGEHTKTFLQKIIWNNITKKHPAIKQAELDEQVALRWKNRRSGFIHRFLTAAIWIHCLQRQPYTETQAGQKFPIDRQQWQPGTEHNPSHSIFFRRWKTPAKKREGYKYFKRRIRS